MSAIRNIPMGRKFVFAFGIVCLLCLCLGTYTFFTFRSIASSTGEVSGNAFPSVIHLSQAREALNVLRRADIDLMLCPTSCRLRRKVFCDAPESCLGLSV